MKYVMPDSFERVILVKLAGEISLKSDSVRSHFVKILKNNCEHALAFKNVQVKNWISKPGRFYIFVDNPEKALETLAFQFGIHSVVQGYFFENLSKTEIIEKSAQLSFIHFKPKGSFAVRAKREGTHDFTSQDLAKSIGAHVLKLFPKLTVNLSKPAQEVFVEVRDHFTVVYFGELVGPDGLPVGASGTVGVMYSSAREDSLCIWRMLFRGCKVIPLIEKPLSSMEFKKLQLLQKWNAYRSLEPLLLSELNSKKYSLKMEAIVRSDPVLSIESFECDQELLKQYTIPVFRAFPFWSNAFMKEKLKLIE